MKIKILAIIVLALCALNISAQTQLCAPATKEMKHKIVGQVNKIDNSNSDGVSRIGVYLISMPNTSSRIDSVTLVNGNRNFAASDIDGIDFKRYFQWEEDGEIYVEVDFPKQTKINSDAKIIFHTVHGDLNVPFKNKKKGASEK